jgi:hypothetical protein
MLTIKPAFGPVRPVAALRRARVAVFAAGCLLAAPCVSPASAQEPWPFDRPPIATLRASEKKVFAHYFTPFPLSLDNLPADAPDRHASDRLSPHGSPSKKFPQGRYYSTGGYMRQRPLPTPPQPPGVDFELVNLRKEIRSAIELGLDGFVLDILNYGAVSSTWPRALKLMRAAVAEDPGFKILLMPDLSGSAFQLEVDPKGANLIKAVRELAAFPSAYRHNGELVISPFNTHARPPSWWQAWIETYERETGDKVFFVPLFQNWKAHVAAYADISRGITDWGTRAGGPGTENGSARWRNFAHDVKAVRADFICMAPVGPQDFRPKDDPLGPRGVRFWEANNSFSYRAAWSNAIEGGADWVHLITWNDYGEAAEIAPSTGTQYAFYDLTAYYTTWFKTGSPPPITRDVIYYFHRLHHSEAPFSAEQIAPFRRAGETPVSDQIELLAFITGTAPVTLEIELNGVVHRTTAEPGIRSFRVPMPKTGHARPSFRLIRDGEVAAQVTSAFEINNDDVVWQDFLYRAGSSSRPPVPLAH